MASPKKIAVRNRKAPAGAEGSVRAFNLHGYDVGVTQSLSDLSVQDLKTALGTHGVSAAQASPVIWLQLVENADDFEEGGPLHTPDVLLGEYFALNYATRTIYYPRAKPNMMHMKNLGDQNPLVRTIIFCVGMLAEFNGLESVARLPTQFQAPLYLHASAVLTKKGALVFCGECTFGKTTISTLLLKDFPLLEDDQATLLISTSPEHAAPPRVVTFGDARAHSKGLDLLTAPLAGIFWLKKDPENALEKMDQSEAAALMLHPMVNWKHAGAIKQRLLLFKALFAAVPCKRLAFKKESAALVEFLKREGYA